MNSHRAIAIVIIFIVLVGALLAASQTFVPGRATIDTGRIEITHSRNGDEQTYRGLAYLENKCDQLASAISVTYTNPPTARIDLRSTKAASDSCESANKVKEFVVSVVTPEEPTIEATLDGKPMTVVLVSGR